MRDNVSLSATELVYTYVMQCRPTGFTIHDIKSEFPKRSHQAIASALSRLRQEGVLTSFRLTTGLYMYQIYDLKRQPNFNKPPTRTRELAERRA